MQKIIVMLFVLTAVAGTVNAVVWNAAGPDPANWGIAANWDPVGVPGSTDKVQFTNDMAECIVDSDVVTGQVVVGDNGGTGFTRELTIVDGGSLVTGGSWTTSGYNRSANITVEEGGSFETTTRFGVAWFDNGGSNPANSTPQTSYLNVNGGDVLIGGHLQIGRDAPTGNNTAIGLHTAIVNVNSGRLEVTGTIQYVTWEGSRIDIRYGTMIVNGDYTGNFDTLVASGYITGFGGLGTVEAVFADGKTTITAAPPNPLDPSPVNETVIAGTFDLSWTNIEPNLPGTSVWVDVWFGRDPEALVLVVTIPPTGENTTAAEVTTVDDNESGDVTYYWKVNSYTFGNPGEVDYNSDGEPNYVEGTLFTFDVTGDRSPENVNAGVDMITWIGQPVDLTGTYDDDGTSAVDVTWSVASATGADVEFSATNIVDPTVTIGELDDISIDNTVWNWVSDLTAVGDPGTAGIELSADTPWPDDEYEADGIYTSIAEIPAGTYTVKYDYFVPVGGGVAFQDWWLEAGLYDVTNPVDPWDGSEIIGGEPWAYAADTAGTWQTFEFEFTTSVPTDTVWVGAGSYTQGYDVFVKNVEVLSLLPDPAIVTLTFTVQDGANPAVSDDLIVTVYADACEAARVGDGRAANYPGDFNSDCIVDFTDLVEEIVVKWLDDYTLTESIPVPGQ